MIHTEGCDCKALRANEIEVLKHKEENAKYKAVVEAAREMLENYLAGLTYGPFTAELEKALKELEGEHE
jgi:hypothetical protein